MRLKTAVALGLVATAAALAACTALDPFATAPTAAKPPPKGRPAPPGRVAICYNDFKTGRAEARAQAQQQCPKGTLAQPVEADRYLQVCPLLLPTHATFACVPAPR